MDKVASHCSVCEYRETKGSEAPCKDCDYRSHWVLREDYIGLLDELLKREKARKEKERRK